MVPVCYKHHIKNMYERENVGHMERIMLHSVILIVFVAFYYLNKNII